MSDFVSETLTAVVRTAQEIAVKTSETDFQRYIQTHTNNGQIVRFDPFAAAHYRQNEENVKGYIWLAALDLRTCVICRHRHGRKYPLNRQPQCHVNCRCTMIPFLETVEPIETGEEKFKKLTAQQRAAVLGSKRAKLYDDGLEMANFVGERETEYGKTPYVKNIRDLPTPKGRRKSDPVKPKPERVCRGH